MNTYPLRERALGINRATVQMLGGALLDLRSCPNCPSDQSIQLRRTPKPLDGTYKFTNTSAPVIALIAGHSAQHNKKCIRW
jgi:hypothetical protein